MSIRPQISPQGPRAIGPYSQAVRAGDWLIVSGQIALDPASGDLVGNNAAEQMAQILSNVDAMLADWETDFSCIAKTTLYLTDMADFLAVNAAYAEAFGSHMPARATVGVAQLPMGAKILMEAWVYAPVARDANEQ